LNDDGEFTAIPETSGSAAAIHSPALPRPSVIKDQERTKDQERRISLTFWGSMTITS
jgi:hypothetical protein